MTLTITHQNDDVVMYMRRQGGRYMSMNESEFRDFLHSVEEINEKIRQCKLVMAGKLPTPWMWRSSLLLCQNPRQL